MATYNKFFIFVEHLSTKVHTFLGIIDSFYIALSATSAPPAFTNTVLANITQTTGGSYAPLDTQNTSSRASGTITETATDVVFTAVTTPMGPFQCAVRYNLSATLFTNPLINWWDYGAPLTLQAGETFTVDFQGPVSTLV